MKRFLILGSLLILLLLIADARAGRLEVGAGGAWDLDDGGGTTGRRHFFDHGHVAGTRGDVESWRERKLPGVEAVEDGVLFRYRDRGYERVWLVATLIGPDPLPMTLNAEGTVWEVLTQPGTGSLEYQFRVLRDDGTIRQRTDPTNPSRIRDPERGWVSRVEILGDGTVELEQRRGRDRKGEDAFDFDPIVHLDLDYQRADGVYLSIHPSFSGSDPWAPTVLGELGYGFASERSGGRLDLLQPLVAGGSLRAVFSAYDASDFTDRTAVGDFENSVATLMFREDSRDWYRRKGVALGVELDEVSDFLVRCEFRSDDYESLEREVVAGWGGRPDFLPIPEVDEGVMRSVFLRARWGSDFTHLWAQYENGRSNTFSTDFDFEQLILQGRLRWEVGLSQHLDLRARWGQELSGSLPAQRRFVAGGIGTVRGYPYQSLFEPATDGAPTPLGGVTLALLNAEYVLGVGEDLAVSLFGDSGMVWAGGSEGESLEDLKSSIGFGLLSGGQDDISLRLDFIQPLDSGSGAMVQARLLRPF